jgi:hypothetical protein
MSVLDRFVELRNGAVDLPDVGDYALSAWEMNPAVFARLLEVVKTRRLVPEIWEQFASLESAEKFWAMAFEARVSLYSWGLAPAEGGMRGYLTEDSTMDWPRFETAVGIGGVLMHPPYFGSVAMSEDSGDLSAVKDVDEYRRRLWAAFRTASRALQDGGVLCAVGRRYRFGGCEVLLDEWMAEAAESVGFVLEEVWRSCPDVVLLFRWG